MISNPFGAGRFRHAGDRARDQRDWATAEVNYRRYLARRPDDAGIWTQLGHVSKEQGKSDAAIDAYGKAVALTPDDADPWLHLAHLADRAERRDLAIEAFSRHYALTRARQSWDVLVEMGHFPASIPAQSRRPRTFLLIDDLLKYLTGNHTLSGIQRVQVGLIDTLLDTEPDYCYINSSTLKLYAKASFWLIPVAAVRDLIGYVTSGTPMVRAELDLLIENISRVSTHVSFVENDLVFVPGAFWLFEHTGENYRALKNQGVIIGVYVYDIIPISHPEFCDPALVEVFNRAFAGMILSADFLVTISAYVADVIERFIADYELRPVPVQPLPLAHFLTTSSSAMSASKQFLDQQRARLGGGEPYALYVSTLEGRKNHLYVLTIWRELMRQGYDLPHLVFVGRPGWRCRGAFDFLDGTNNLNGRVHILHGISDGDLSYLYENCLFTLFTSFVEGWGLPVGESLVFGKPCVASMTCSIPEVGGDFVDYVDPFNMRDGMEVIKRIANDHAYRDMRAARIAREFKPRTWGAVARSLSVMIADARSAPSIAPEPFKLPAGKRLSFKLEPVTVDDLRPILQYPARALLGNGFYNQEAFGSWMRGPTATLELPTQLEAGRVARLMIELAAPPNAGGRLAIGSPLPGIADPYASSIAIGRFAGSSFIAIADRPVDADGYVRARITMFDVQERLDGDGREIYIGIVSVAYVDAASAGADHRLLEEFTPICHFERANQRIVDPVTGV